jgi:hypothetical protein
LGGLGRGKGNQAATGYELKKEEEIETGEGVN